MSTPKIDLTAISERVGDVDRKTDRAVAYPGRNYDNSLILAIRASASDVPALLAHVEELTADLKAWDDWFAEMTRIMNGNPS